MTLTQRLPSKGSQEIKKKESGKKNIEGGKVKKDETGKYRGKEHKRKTKVKKVQSIMELHDRARGRGNERELKPASLPNLTWQRRYMVRGKYNRES